MCVCGGGGGVMARFTMTGGVYQPIPGGGVDLMQMAMLTVPAVAPLGGTMGVLRAP